MEDAEERESQHGRNDLHDGVPSNQLELIQRIKVPPGFIRRWSLEDPSMVAEGVCVQHVDGRNKYVKDQGYR